MGFPSLAPGPSFAFVSQGKAVTKPQVLLGSHSTPANAARNIIKTAMAASTPSLDLLVVIVYPLLMIDLARTLAYGDELIILQTRWLILVANRVCHQGWIPRYTVQLNRPIAIHTFGGRGSPIVSFPAA